MDQDNLRTKFSALNVDFSSLSPDPLGSWSPAQAGVKDGTDMLLNITSTGDELLRIVNIDDLD